MVTCLITFSLVGCGGGGGGGDTIAATTTTVAPTTTTSATATTTSTQQMTTSTTVGSTTTTTTISPANSTPVADAGSDQSVTTGSTVSLDGGASFDGDPGTALIYSWTFFSKPAGSNAVLANSMTANPLFIPDVDGEYIIQLIVNDSMIDSTPDTITVTSMTTGILLSSLNFTDGTMIPRVHACTNVGGSNLSPQLEWSNLPANTVELAILVDDEISPCGTEDNACVHWNIFDLNPAVTSLEQGTDLSLTATEGRTYTGEIGYQGPCPPSEHTYSFTIYALNTDINGSLLISSAVTRSEFVNLFSDKIISSSTITGRFNP
ncbi:MAG: YbhB/YbcL family Raf kinase inhibitor-like protein [Proteobacteria bacterium]|nr:YbhB/YbcL family Raf kinase inhibitor-like protein [Pseudomonadota bacterium]MBU1686855.1 YbhB/YbcL family Raf kinase inhibitor-like protein [Pseudomonadota bacterium]